MKREAFKPGQLAYEISPEKGVLLTKLRTTDCNVYTVLGQANAYTFDGRILEDGRLPSLYHANEDNYKKLCDFFGQDAVPKPFLQGSDLALKVIKNSNIYRIGWVSNENDATARFHRHTQVIVGLSCLHNKFLTANGDEWKYCVLIDPNTGDEITELPEK